MYSSILQLIFFKKERVGGTKDLPSRLSKDTQPHLAPVFLYLMRHEEKKSNLVSVVEKSNEERQSI